jgi:hypothetical protein
MLAAIPSTKNARMMTQTRTIATVIPADIVVMSIMNRSLKMSSLRDFQLLRRPAKRGAAKHSILSRFDVGS